MRETKGKVGKVLMKESKEESKLEGGAEDKKHRRGGGGMEQTCQLI